MEFVRFFCIVLAGSLLLVSSSFAQSTEDDKKDTTNSESTPKVESTLTPSTTPTTEKLITTIATESSSEKAPSTTEKNTVEQSTVTSPTESSSAEPSTTTHVPSSSTTPAPPKFTWKVHENDPNKTVCLIVQVELSFKDFNNPETVTVPTDAAVDVDKSKCGNDTQVLALKINDTYSLELTFEKEEIEKEAPKFYLQSLTFTNGTETFTLNGTINKDYMVGHLNKSFKCIDEETHDLTHDSAPANKSVTWKDVRVQAFMSKNNNGDFDTAEECNQDGTSDVVPIAVGCALAGLVVVVLIAYLVGRRRSRQKGYQSV